MHSTLSRGKQLSLSEQTSTHLCMTDKSSQNPRRKRNACRPLLGSALARALNNRHRAAGWQPGEGAERLDKVTRVLALNPTLSVQVAYCYTLILKLLCVRMQSAFYSCFNVQIPKFETYLLTEKGAIGK